MIKNFSSKVLSLILFLFLFYLIANLFYIKNQKFKNFINDNYPKIKKTIFATPAILDQEKEYMKNLDNKKMKPSYIERNIKSTQFLDFSENKYPLNSYNYKSNRMKAVGFIDFHKDNLFFISGTGEVKFIKEKKFSNFENDAINIKTNIKDIIKDNSFFDTSTKILSQFNSISDVLIYKGYIYLSFNRLVRENCYTKSIIRSKIDFEYLEFKDFFYNKNECRTYNSDKRKFNGHQSGGRMVIIDSNSIYNFFNKESDKILFTVGDYRSNRSEEIPLAQSEKSIFGKTLLLDIKSDEYKIFSKGHRNPQGLFYDKNDQIIISTEHGPYGGDEINILNFGKNYGWPLSSYGENYLRTKADKIKDFYFEKNHSNFGFEEPLIAFTKSIGISEIIKVPENFHYKWKDSYLATSLNGHVILRFNLNDKKNKIQTIELINVGERVRDIKFQKRKIYVVLENSATIGVYSILE